MNSQEYLTELFQNTEGRSPDFRKLKVLADILVELRKLNEFNDSKAPYIPPVKKTLTTSK